MDNKQVTAEWIAQQRKLWDEDSLARFVLDAKAAIPELADALEASMQREAEKDAIIARLTAELAAADVAPVVRCKDCRFYAIKQSSLCDMHNTAVNAEDYCSYGVKNDGGEHHAD